MQQQTKAPVSTMFAGLVIAALAVSIFLVVQAAGLVRQAAALKDETHRLREDVTMAEAMAADTHLRQRVTGLAAPGELAGIMDDLGVLAEKKGIDISAVDFPEPVASRMYQKQPVIITLHSGYAAAGEFIGAVTDYPRTQIHVHDFRMRAAGQNERPVTSRLTLQIYLEAGHDG